MIDLLSKKINKGVLAFIFVCMLLLAVSGAVWADDDRVTGNLPKFTDLPESHWAYTHITRLTYEGAITGYPDGTFGPSRNITRAEFLAVVVGALLSRPEAPPAEQHWATNIMQAAEKNNLLEAGEFAQDTWGQAITRQEMAKIMARGAQFVRKEALETKTSVYTSKITDFASIPERYLSYVAQVYSKGIVTGYPDGSFGGERQATRAEAATMVVRLIDPVYRLGGGSDISFDPAVDVAADGRMKLAKAEEYLMQTLQSLKFYEENGKFYFEGNVAETPEGFENTLNIGIIFKQETDLPIVNYGSYPLITQQALPNQGPFKEEVPGISLKQIAGIEITMFIDAPNHTNKLYDRYGYEVVWVINSNNDNRIDAVDSITYGKETHKFYDLSTIFLWLSK